MTLVPRHLSREAQPGDRGRALGRAQRDAVHHTIGFYRRLLAEDLGLGDDEVVRRGAQVGAHLAAHAPALVEEMEGIAAGAEVDPDLVFAINARSELLVGASYAGGPGIPLALECTAVGALPSASSDGHCLLAQNWDYHPDLAASRLLWTVEHADGAFTTFTEAGILAKSGLNSAHVGVVINFLATDLDAGPGGLPVHLISRRLLAESRDMADALRIIQEGRSRISICFNVGYAQDDEGVLVSVEVAPDGTQYVWPNEAGVLVHANHFRAQRRDDRFLGPSGSPGSTLVREWYAERELSTASVGADDLKRVLSSRFNGTSAICQSWNPTDAWLHRSETLAGLIFDLTSLRLAVAGGQPALVPFEELSLEELLAEPVATSVVS